MELYLVQHGQSKSEQEDPARPLTDRGREEVSRVARAAARAGITVAAIHHSGKLRAQQTAELFAQALRPRSGIGQMDGLAPNDDPAPAVRAVQTLESPVMLVGHLPHLSRLTSLLVHGDAAKELVAFRMGALVCLEVTPEGGRRVRWILTPELAT